MGHSEVYKKEKQRKERKHKERKKMEQLEEGKVNLNHLQLTVVPNMH